MTNGLPFQLKADFIPFTVLKITSTDIAAIEAKLQETIQKAPAYFLHAPIVIDAVALDDDATIDLKALQAMLMRNKIIPVGVRGLPKHLEKIAVELNLARLKSPSLETQRTINDEPSLTTGKPKESKQKALATEHDITTKIITKPVRAGTQVYAKGGDLVILAGVNPGAECFADGNIHVYGPLRGRALAGANGNTSARIFCKSLEAELIAIAGHYTVKENMRLPATNQGMIQVYLNNDELHIDTI